MTAHIAHLGRMWRPLLLAVGVLAGCDQNQTPDERLESIKAPEIERVMPAAEALAGSHVPTLDPVTMYEAEIRRVLEPAPRCDFRYTSTGRTVLAIGLNMSEGFLADAGATSVTAADVPHLAIELEHAARQIERTAVHA